MLFLGAIPTRRLGNTRPMAVSSASASVNFPRLKQADVTQRAPPGVQLEVGVEETAVGRGGMSGQRGGERPG